MLNSENKPVIEVSGLSKIYRSYPTPRHRLLEILSAGKKRYVRETRALDDVSFTLEKGARFGIVGENGSGKSTLLKVLAGVLTPSSGEVSVRGRVSALLELGAGFNAELTGRENINQFCMLHGMHGDQIESALPEIIRFSELQYAVEHPVKTYSSGMSMRLAFSCAVYVQPDILIVDEALSVGDSYFQSKCMHKIRAMLDQGIAFIYVTHGADAIRSLCNRGIWMEKGKIRLAGTASEVGAAYQSEIFSRLVRAGYKNEMAGKVEPVEAATHVASAIHGTDGARQAAFSSRVEPLRTGSGEIRIDDICLVDKQGAETDSVDINCEMRVRVFFHANFAPPARSPLTLGVTDSSGRQILHFNSAVHGLYASDAAPHIGHMMEFVFSNPLCPGEYGLIAGVCVLTDHPRNKGLTLVTNVIDYCVGGARFSVRFPEERVSRDLWGVVHTDYSVAMHSLD